jgi:hypothetical protein
MNSLRLGFVFVRYIRKEFSCVLTIPRQGDSDNAQSHHPREFIFRGRRCSDVAPLNRCHDCGCRHQTARIEVN